MHYSDLSKQILCSYHTINIKKKVEGWFNKIINVSENNIRVGHQMAENKTTEQGPKMAQKMWSDRMLFAIQAIVLAYPK